MKRREYKRMVINCPNFIMNAFCKKQAGGASLYGVCPRRINAYYENCPIYTRKEEESHE